MRVLPILVLTLILGGCTEENAGLNFSGPLIQRSAPETISVARGAVVIGGPKGYCIDRRGSRLTGDAAFILLASCASITGVAEDGFPSAPGLLTASVDKETGPIPGARAFQDFFSTPLGKATLARDSQASSVKILESRRLADALLMRVQDSSPPSTEGLEKTYWRGLLDLDGRLITVTVNAFESRPFGADEGRQKLIDFLERIRTENQATEPR